MQIDVWKSVGFSGNLQALRGLAAASVIFFSCQSNERQLDLNNLYIVGQFGAGATLCFFLSSVFLSLSNICGLDRKDWLCGYTMWKSRFIDMAIHWQGDHLVRAAELEKKRHTGRWRCAGSCLSGQQTKSCKDVHSISNHYRSGRFAFGIEPSLPRNRVEFVRQKRTGKLP